MVSARRRSQRRLGQILRDAGFLQEQHLRTALDDQRRWGGRIGRILVDRGYVDDETVAHALARQLGLSAVHLDSQRVDPAALALLTPELARRYQVLPFAVQRSEKVLRVASADPTHAPTLEALSRHCKLRIQVCIATEVALARAMAKHYPESADAAGLARRSVDVEGVTQVNLAFSWPEHLTQVLQREQAKTGDRLHTLEAIVEAQGKALRSMLELLDREGVVRREQFLERMYAAPSAPPPLPLERTARSRKLPELSE